MTLVELNPGQAVNPDEVLAVHRAGDRTRIKLTSGALLLVKRPFEDVVGLLCTEPPPCT